MGEDEDLGLDRPVGAVVTGIWRAIRVPFDLALWEDEPWALLEAAEKPEWLALRVNDREKSICDCLAGRSPWPTPPLAPHGAFG